MSHFFCPGPVESLEEGYPIFSSVVDFRPTKDGREGHPAGGPAEPLGEKRSANPEFFDAWLLEPGPDPQLQAVTQEVVPQARLLLGTEECVFLAPTLGFPT